MRRSPRLMRTVCRPLAELLGQWHEWRGGYSHERSYARVAFASPADEEDELQRLQMLSVEEAIAALPRDFQLALQHFARAQALGVEVIMNPRLPTGTALENLTERALDALRRRLSASGI